MKTSKLLNPAMLLAAAMTLALSCEKENPLSLEDGVIPLTKSEERINVAANQFGFEVFHRLYKEDQVLFSPLSASLALSMTATGANGNTASQMIKTLGFERFAMEDVNGYYKKMVDALLKVDPGTAFEIANSIWVSDRVNVKKGFITDCKENYASEVFPGVDFGSQATIDKVNKWCSDNTHGKIPTILEKPDQRLVMALINALYFNGTWTSKFQDVFKDDFTNIQGKKEAMEMMFLQTKLSYAEYDGFKMVDLPYGNGSFSMKVILPDVKEDFGKAAKRFDANTLDKLNGRVSEENVSMKMPKFTFDSNSDLKDALIDMGMTDAFSSAEADFSKIDDGLFISFVKQKTFIDVNESGTEAAAVTIVGMDKNAVGGPQEKVIYFFADRPFLFVIQEKSTGAVLFIGQKVS